MTPTRRQTASGVATLALALLLLAPQDAPAQDPAGRPVASVESLVGAARVIRFNQRDARPLGLADPVYEGDRVETLRDSRLRLVFRDATAVVLGEGSSLVVDWYLAEPDLDQRSVLLTIPEGIVRFLVSALVPRSSFEVQTRTAVASVRGTGWMMEVAPAASSIVVLEGGLAVWRAGGDPARAVRLREGEGTTVEAGADPSPPAVWSRQRVESLARATALP
jgi:hypothetical protein